MWDAIAYVTSGVTLAAFLAAVAAWVYRSKLRQRERLIRTAPDNVRANLVVAALEFFNVNTEKLTREQQFNLALQQIQSREVRFRTTAIVVTVIAVLTASVALFAIYREKALVGKQLTPACTGVAFTEPGDPSGLPMKVVCP